MVNKDSSPIRGKSALERRVAMGLGEPGEEPPQPNNEVDVEQFMVGDDESDDEDE